MNKQESDVLQLLNKNWQGLTVKEVGKLWDTGCTGFIPQKQLQFYLDINTKLKERNEWLTIHYRSL